MPLHASWKYHVDSEMLQLLLGTNLITEISGILEKYLYREVFALLELRIMKVYICQDFESVDQIKSRQVLNPGFHYTSVFDKIGYTQVSSYRLRATVS